MRTDDGLKGIGKGTYKHSRSLDDSNELALGKLTHETGSTNVVNGCDLQKDAAKQLMSHAFSEVCCQQAPSYCSSCFQFAKLKVQCVSRAKCCTETAGNHSERG